MRCPGLLARSSTGRYRVVESSSSVIDLRARARSDGGANAAARPARPRASRSRGSADAHGARGRDPLGRGRPLARRSARRHPSPALAMPSSGARGPAPRSGAMAALRRARPPRAVARARPPRAGRGSTAATSCRRARCCSTRRRRAPCPPDHVDRARAPAACRRRGHACDSRSGRSPGRRRASRGRSRVQLAGDRGTGRRARGAAQPSGRRRARLDPVARPGLRRPRGDLHAARRCARRRARRRRSRSACRAPRGWPAMRAGRRSGVSTSASVQVALAQFRCCVQTFPHRSRPCWWEEAPIRCSTSTSPCSPHAHDCTPTTQILFRRSARWPGCGSPWPRTARSARSSAPRSTSTSSICDDCIEWRALAEAVVLHVRTTPPSPVPAGLLPELPRKRSRRRGVRGARRRRRRRRLGWPPCSASPPRAGTRRRPRPRPSPASCGRPRSSSGGIRATSWTGAADRTARRARRPDFVTRPGTRGVAARCGMPAGTDRRGRADASGTVRAPRES